MKLPGVYGVLATGGGKRREDQNYYLIAKPVVSQNVNFKNTFFH